LGEDNVPRGTGPALEFFALDYGFLTLKFRKVCAEVFAFNTIGLRLHEKFGLVREGTLVKHCFKNGRYEDIVCIAGFSARWADERVKLKSRIFGKDETR
jgi:RimJ/RimL family protein N-acetyltransferase